MATELARKQRSYTEEEITRGLTEVALCAGNTRLAAKRLEARGHHFSRSVLELWRRDTKADRYQQMRREFMPRIHDTIASECEDLAIQYAAAEADSISRYFDKAHELKPADLAPAARNFATGKGINLQHANLLRDKPTSIVEQRSPEQILQRLANTVDSTAVEITDADAVPTP